MEASNQVHPLSFARDIRPMFTEMDVKHMSHNGLDLSSRDAVAKDADQIYLVVANGTMPPPGSGETRWAPEMCALFKEWQNQGCPP
jgi:hypothetical protein